MPAINPQTKLRGEIATELLDARVLVTCMRGFVTAALCERTFEEFRAHAANTRDAPWIIDTLAITGFQPGAVSVGARWFDVFKKQGGTQIIMVSDQGAVRMAAATLAFAVHIKVQSCRSLAEAYAFAHVEPRARKSINSFPAPKSGVS
jgi:hypothetical protein